MVTIFQAKGLKKQDGVAILIHNIIDCKPKPIKRDGERQYMVTKEKILRKQVLTSICQTQKHPTS